MEEIVQIGPLFSRCFPRRHVAFSASPLTVDVERCWIFCSWYAFQIETNVRPKLVNLCSCFERQRKINTAMDRLRYPTDDNRQIGSYPCRWVLFVLGN